MDSSNLVCLILILMMFTTFQELHECFGGENSGYLKVTGLHPWNESVNETSNILAFDAVSVILQVVDDVGADCDLLLGVRGSQIRVKLI